MPKEITTVVELTENHLKLVQSKDSPQGKILTQILLGELASGSEEAAVNSLRHLMSQVKTAPTELICVLPRNQTTVRMLKLPSQEVSEIENMISLQIAKHTPYTREDVIVDYLVAGKDAEGYSQVLLVIAHKDAVNRYTSIFKAARLNLRQLALSSQGICNLYLYYQRKLRLAPGKEVLVILDIDEIDSEVCFYYQGNLVFSRALQFGSRQINEEKIGSLLEELRLTLATYQKEQNGIEVTRLVLTSASQNMEAISQRIESELSLNVEVINPQSELLKEKGVDLPVSWLRGEISANAVLGLALQKPDKPLNLLPATLLAEHKEVAKNRQVAYLIVLSLAVMGLVLLSVLVRIYQKTQYFQNISRSLGEEGEKTKAAEQMLRKTALLRERLSPSFSPVDIIYEIYQQFPQGMSLSILNLEDNGNISLEGSSILMTDVFDFQGRLEKSARFKNVEVKSATKRNTSSGEVTDFKINCQAERAVK
jgi:Tfp pilus assembly PilM family ATPase